MTLADLVELGATRFTWAVALFVGGVGGVILACVFWVLGYLSRCRDERLSHRLRLEECRGQQELSE